MSQMGDLILTLCPDGVESRCLGEVGVLVRGTGLQKKDLTDKGVAAIHYGQVFTTYNTATHSTKSFVAADLAAKLRRAKRGDLVIATTSENDEDVCKAVAWLGEGEVAISGDAYIYAHEMDPLYVAHFFQTSDFHDQKKKAITGTKVRRVSGTNLARIRIPVPPREVQEAIAKTLESLRIAERSLREALITERVARLQQFEYYRDRLVEEAAPASEWVAVGDLGSLYGGLTGKSKADFTDGNAPFVTYRDVFAGSTVNVCPESKVQIRAGERQNEVLLGDVIFTASSESRADVAMAAAVIEAPPEPLYLNSFSFGFRPADSSLDPEYAKHMFHSGAVRRQIVKTGSGVTRINVSKERFKRVKVPVPSIDNQRQIAATLDTLDAVSSGLAIALPTELAARRQQYEHYRDKLFIFKERGVTA